jgi:hypothetical protein
VRGLWPYVALALVLGLAFVVIGALMPWATVAHADGTGRSYSGLSGSGVVTLAAAGLALAGSALGAWRWRRQPRGRAAALAALAGPALWGLVMTTLALAVCWYEWHAGAALAQNPWGDVWRWEDGLRVSAAGALTASLAFAVVFGAARAARDQR